MSINTEVKYSIRLVQRTPHKTYPELACKRKALPGYHCAAVYRNEIFLIGQKS